MSILRAFYLALAIWGALWGALNIWSGHETGFGGHMSPMSGEILVAEIALFVWCIAEVYVRKNWPALVALPLTWLLGLGCGLPLYLFLRTVPPR